MRLKTIIIVNRIHIENTWRDAILEFTDASEKSILCLTTDIIIDILNGKINADKYDIFIAVHRTIYNAATQVGWEGIHELFKILGIGLKIYDEAHREFANTTMIDTHTDTRKTLYLTATLKLSNPKANYIFQNLFYNIPKFDQRKLGYTDAKKHIAMIAYFYNSHPGIDAQRQCYNPRMHFFNSKAHSMYQVTEDTNFFTILDTNIVKFAIKNKFRCLILVARIKACEIIADFIKENHPEISCGIYNSSIDSVEKQRVLKEDQVIISTNSSLGESVTIKDLRFVLNCEAHRSFGDQASGRLRKLPDPNLMCYYAELVDNGFKSITSQWKSRKKHYAEIFNEIFEIKL
jgi:hypothetical protein